MEPYMRAQHIAGRIIGNRKCKMAALLMVALAPMILAGGCSSARAHVSQIPVQPQVIQSSVRFQKEYVLWPGDQLEVSVRRAPEVSRTVVIRSDGNITLPIVQDVKAAGLTPHQLTDALTALLSKRLIEPEVTVIPIQVRQPMVYVLGDVNVAAGTAVPFRDAPTAAQAIAMAGGLRRSGDARYVSIIRLSEDGYLRAIPVQDSAGGQPGPLMALRAALLMPDDIVFVPENGRSQVSRFLDDMINRPLSGVSEVAGLYLNFRLVNKVK